MVRPVFWPPLLGRRDIILGGAASLALSSTGLAARTTLGPPLSEVQPTLRLEVSIGSLVGSALGVLIYQAFARNAPASLIASFSSAIIRATSTVNMAAPAKDYVDFRVSQAGGDLKRSNSQLKQDMSLDLVAFRTLADAVRAQSQAIERMRNDSNTSIRQFRTELASLRQEIQTIRSEQSRSQNSTAVYGSTDRQLKSSRVDPRGESEKSIMGVMKEADRLRVHCRDLQDQILRGR